MQERQRYLLQLFVSISKLTPIIFLCVRDYYSPIIQYQLSTNLLHVLSTYLRLNQVGFCSRISFYLYCSHFGGGQRWIKAQAKQAAAWGAELWRIAIVRLNRLCIWTRFICKLRSFQKLIMVQFCPIFMTFTSTIIFPMHFSFILVRPGARRFNWNKQNILDSLFYKEILTLSSFFLL